MGLKKWLRAKRKKREKEGIEERALALAKVQLDNLIRLKRDIESAIKVITNIHGDPKERLFLSGEERKSITAKAMDIFKGLREVKRMETIEIGELVRLVKGKFRTKETENLEKELNIEEELRNKTLTLETFFNRIVKVVHTTGERKYIYPLFVVVLEFIDVEIKLAEKEVESFQKSKESS